MKETLDFLVQHGVVVLFAVVFAEQMGVPLPTVPWFLAVGALSATGRFNASVGVGVAVIACLFADMFWFFLGRRRGMSVLGWLCHISLEPDSCVRRTQNLFTRYGLRGLTVAKFVPGLSTVLPPLAGMSGISITRFLVFDTLGSLLYCGSFILVGYCFSYQIGQIRVAMTHVGGSALSLFAVFTVAYIAYKYWRRSRLLHLLQIARITVDELRQKLDSAEAPVLLDVRSIAELRMDPSMITGARHIALSEVAKRHHEFPHDRDIVFYCSCPNEGSSAHVALLLHRKGFTRVRALQGGINAWRQANYPTEPWSPPRQRQMGAFSRIEIPHRRTRY